MQAFHYITEVCHIFFLSLWLCVDLYVMHRQNPGYRGCKRKKILILADALQNGNFNIFAREGARYIGAGMMYLISKRIKKKHDIGEERPALYAAGAYCTHKWKGVKFFLHVVIPASHVSFKLIAAIC